jgi:prepilin-type N-terminal cleavage/methylation domain-containing protein
MILKFKKGFSLVELLVVIAIIGILAAVGITAYQGYTQSAKEKAVLANHSQLVKFLNAEMAKCAGGEGVFIWDTHGNDKCSRSTSTGTHDAVVYVATSANAAQIALYAQETLAIKNPYNVNNNAAVIAGDDDGMMLIACSAGTNCTITSHYDGDKTEVATVPYM